MAKNLDISDSNDILKTIITIIIVAGIAYLIYYLYNQHNLNKKVESENNNYSKEETIYRKSVNLSEDDHKPSMKRMIDEGISNVNYKMTGNPSGLNNPIMNKTEYLPKGNIVGGEAIEHFSNDSKFKTERNLTSFPKDQLTAEELLPQDNSSLWAQVNPSGEGSLKDRNFLQSGYHIGINTVGQTLRNANLQLRSEPPCPQVKISPWLQSTIEPDVSRKPFEIGGCN